MDEEKGGGVAGAVQAHVEVAVVQRQDRMLGGRGAAVPVRCAVRISHEATVAAGTRGRIGRMFPCGGSPSMER
ncbi:hypothetical protein GCM10023336_25230 [Streptomyces similanensis]|uniref:Uncharacterized protein n=1 Tax=Streptomyces similanensis TaxID=1274988 RepID=A0ABP9K9J6_9ACTN